jgi:hypothetical protein
MSAVDSQLLGIARQALKVCTSVSDALRQVLGHDAEEKGVTLSLQSRYGVMFKVPEGNRNTTMTICTHPLLEVLYSGRQEERIALLFGAREWNMVSCFSISGLAFYPVITIPAPPDELRWVRYELLAALDCFSLNCKQTLSNFILKNLEDAPFPVGTAKERKGTREKLLLENLLGYSEKVDCTALIDSDGFVLSAVGQTEKAERIAGNLALFNRQATRDLGQLGAVDVMSLSVGDNENALLIGRTSGKNVSLAISVHGNEAPVIARFLFDTGVSSLQSLAGAGNALGDYDGVIPEKPLRERDSWLSAPKVVPQGAFVTFAGEQAFHDPQCASLIERVDRDFLWLDTRAHAIRAGYVPCSVCNP